MEEAQAEIKIASCERHEVLLGIHKLELCGLNAAEGLIVAVDGLGADGFHRAALVEDDQVVDLGFLSSVHGV